MSWHDDIVKNWNQETSNELSGADIAIVITKHDSVSNQLIKESAPYVFDTTGKVEGVIKF